MAEHRPSGNHLIRIMPMDFHHLASKIAATVTMHFVGGGCSPPPAVQLSPANSPPHPQARLF